MKKDFKGNANKGGVYKIKNTKNGKIYIGSAKSFKKRAYQHQSKLKQGRHSNKHLQASWNKWGEDAFLFEVIEVVNGDKGERYNVEQKHIDNLLKEDKWEQTFNFKKKTVQKERSCFSNDPEITKKLLSEKSKAMWAKRSKKEKQRIIDIMAKNRTKETYEKVSKSHKANTKNIERLKKQIRKYSPKPGRLHPNFGKENKWGKHTDEAKKKIGLAAKGRKRTRKQNAKQSGENHWTANGKGFTAEMREKMSSTKRKMYSKLSIEEKEDLVRPLLEYVKENGGPNLGKKASKKTKEKIRQANLGRKHSKETKKKMSITHKRKQIPYETRIKISQAQKGKKLSKEHIKNIRKASEKYGTKITAINLLTNEKCYFYSIKEAGRKLKICPKTISRILKKENDKTKNWTFVKQI